MVDIVVDDIDPLAALMGVLHKKKLVVFCPFFAEKGGGVWAESKKSLSEKN